MAVLEFPFRFHPAFLVASTPLGVLPSTAAVDVVDDDLDVRFGRWRVRTPLANVKSATVTGDYAWPKVIGPPHVSLRDRGLTFATNPHAGVCISFHRPVSGIDPWGWIRHPALTVTVSDPAALAELLDRPAHDPARTHTDDEPTVDDLVEEVHDELRSLTAAELRRRAAERGVSAVSRRSKAELVELLQPSNGEDATADGATPDEERPASEG